VPFLLPRCCCFLNFLFKSLTYSSTEGLSRARVSQIPFISFFKIFFLPFKRRGILQTVLPVSSSFAASIRHNPFKLSPPWSFLYAGLSPLSRFLFHFLLAWFPIWPSSPCRDDLPRQSRRRAFFFFSPDFLMGCFREAPFRFVGIQRWIFWGFLPVFPFQSRLGLVGWAIHCLSPFFGRCLVFFCLLQP